MIVSAEQAQLAKFANNPLLGAAFDSANIPVTWRPSELILNPVQYKNLYLGALGEFVGRVLLEHEFGVQLNPLSDPSLFELFDFEIGDQVMVDFKNWRGRHDPSAGHERDKVLSKLASVREKTGHEWRAMIINVNPGVNGKITINGGRAGSTGGSQGARILEVPGMLDKDGQVVLTAAQRKLIGGFLLE
ncbi:hypothetical protein FC75_GL000547 [Lacticaseibacillus camelliae DSM 22697 = JCM 13995]|uniref:Restriction endonuclease n=2 Tax=Lacticaseibacillus camelliae TaxID=381742 RepID=A0A0R2ER60_9LACO|nr:hypothetical protein FC75_GL000547 [Lacticaseibacillus camelliae DSM 22697 = JCM 13995]